MMVVAAVMAIAVVMTVMPFYFAHPCGGCGHALEVESSGSDYMFQTEIGIIALHDAGFGLQRAHNGLQLCGLAGAYFRNLVEHHYVAEFYLLDYEPLDVAVGKTGALQRSPAAEFAFHAQRIHHGGYAVEARQHRTHARRHQLRNGAYSLRDRSRLAHPAGFDYYVVETARGGKSGKLFGQVHLQRAAYAAVLQSHKVVLPRAAYHAAAAYERSVDVDFADVIDYYRKTYASLIGKDAVEQGGFAAAEVACEQQYGDFGTIHCRGRFAVS